MGDAGGHARSCVPLLRNCLRLKILNSSSVEAKGIA